MGTWYTHCSGPNESPPTFLLITMNLFYLFSFALYFTILFKIYTVKIKENKVVNQKLPS